MRLRPRVGNDVMEQKVETTIMGCLGTTITIHSKKSQLTKASQGMCCLSLGLHRRDLRFYKDMKR